MKTPSPVAFAVACILASLLSAPALAQSHPDFSGVWVMDPSRSESAHQAEPIGPITLVIKEYADWISVETIQDQQHSTIIYKLDGTQNLNAVGESVAASKM